MRYKFLLFICCIFCANYAFSQFLNGYPDTINDLDMSKPLTKEAVIKALGEPDEYSISYTLDEHGDYTEWYEYKGLSLSTYTNDISSFSCNSPDYIFYGTLQVGKSIQTLHEMMDKGFGRFFETKDLENGSKVTKLGLGDTQLSVYHKDGIISGLYYVVWM